MFLSDGSRSIDRRAPQHRTQAEALRVVDEASDRVFGVRWIVVLSSSSSSSKPPLAPGILPAVRGLSRPKLKDLVVRAELHDVSNVSVEGSSTAHGLSSTEHYEDLGRALAVSCLAKQILIIVHNDKTTGHFSIPVCSWHFTGN